MEQEAPRISTTLSLVATGFGVTLVPESMRSMAREGVTYRTVAGATEAKAFLSLAARRDDASATVKGFVALVRRAPMRREPERISKIDGPRHDRRPRRPRS